MLVAQNSTTVGVATAGIRVGLRAKDGHHDDHRQDQADTDQHGLGMATDATIAAIATPTTVPPMRPNVRFTLAPPMPYLVTASTVTGSQAQLTRAARSEPPGCTPCTAR